MWRVAQGAMKKGRSVAYALSKQVPTTDEVMSSAACAEDSFTCKHDF